MTVWKKAMSYLGLGPDDAYDDYDLPPEPERPPRERVAFLRLPVRRGNGVRPMPRQPRSDADYDRSRGAGDESGLSVRPRSQGSAVRPVNSGAPKAPHTVRPLRFDQAQEVADTFKHGQPVIMNVQEVDRDLLATADRFRQRPLLRPQRQARQGRHRRLPPHAGQRVGRGSPADGRARLRVARPSSRPKLHGHPLHAPQPVPARRLRLHHPELVPAQPERRPSIASSRSCGPSSIRSSRRCAGCCPASARSTSRRSS